MIDRNFTTGRRSFSRLFCFGWFLVLLSGWFPYLIGLDTFIHFWRVETFSSVWLLATLGYLLFSQKESIKNFNLPPREIKLIVLPLAAFVVWSAASMLWAASWKSALYHTLIWAEYLIFYCLVTVLIRSEKNYRMFLKCLTAAFLLIAVPAVIEFGYFTAFNGGGTTLGIRFAKYGEQIVTFLPLLIVGTLKLKGKSFALGTAAMTVLCLLIIATLGRANLFLFGAGVIGTLIIFVYQKGWARFRRRILIFCTALILAPILLNCLTFFSDEPGIPMVNRIKETSGVTYSGNFRKLTTAISLEMFAAHPLSGIGADNFGMQFNNFRAEYARTHPNDGNLSVAESELAERSHNEFLQIAAELGTIGILIFFCFLGGIALTAVRAAKIRRDWLKPSAALLGIVLFLLSSLVSSFSFRLVQNGFVFFFVLAVAVKYLVKTGNDHLIEAKSVAPKFLKLGYAAAILVCMLMLVYCLPRVAAAALSARAFQIQDLNEAKTIFQTSNNLDGENPAPHYFLGLRYFKAKKFAEAVPEFQTSIKLGAATSADYNYLAAAQILAGDGAGAEQTFAEAVNLYPFSPFVRTRCGVILENNGKPQLAAEQFKRALELDSKQANTWRVLIEKGVTAAAQTSLKDDNYAKVDFLMPFQTVAAVEAEREIIHPEEKIQMSFDAP